MVGLPSHSSPCIGCCFVCLFITIMLCFKTKRLINAVKFAILLHLFFGGICGLFFSLTGDFRSVGVNPCWDFLNLCVDVICLQCLQIRIPAAQCSHWSICPHSGWYTCLAVAYPDGCDGYSDPNNGNQTLCFTGSHFRCYV